ncbi:DinB family protein [Nonlabens ulvanivorans]|uniref:DinB family protein n=1 Tax=Nonlabens ulvanivorans TaxID=906888 RepID=UPI0029433829|nr:DinB family protein [Nonlabens ulvanivorans]WOI22430.1 DinB family protein [Nonlabens ulvanivorans]
MKRILLLLAILTSSISTSQQSDVKSAFLEKWNNSKEYLIIIAQSMPEDKYDFKPTRRQMSFKTQLIHIEGNMKWLGTTYFNLETVGEPEDLSNLSKEDLIIALQSRFDDIFNAVKAMDSKKFEEVVEFYAGPKSRLQILNLLQDHVTHHRGQLIVYLNMCNVDLPRYSGW